MQLADHKRDRLVWSQKYESPRDRALQLEDALAEEAAAALSRDAMRAPDTALGAVFALVPFVGARRPDLPAGGTTNSTAYDAYLRGRFLFEKRTLPEALAAIDLLQRATELDPGYAAPYATLSDLQQLLMDLHYRPHDQLLRQAEIYAEKAVALKSRPPRRAPVAGVGAADAGALERSETPNSRRTLALHPGFARAHRWYGGMLLQFGRADECLRMVETSRELDPYDMSGAVVLRAGADLREPAGGCGAAPRAGGRARRPAAPAPDPRAGLRHPRRQGRGRPETAICARRSINRRCCGRRRSRPARWPGPACRRGPSTPTSSRRWRGRYAGDRGQAAPFLERLERERAARRVSPSILARVYAVQARTEDAFRALADSEAERDRELMYLRVSPLYAHIRSEPRFAALVERMHLNR